MYLMVLIVALYNYVCNEMNTVQSNITHFKPHRGVGGCSGASMSRAMQEISRISEPFLTHRRRGLGRRLFVLVTMCLVLHIHELV